MFIAYTPRDRTSDDELFYVTALLKLQVKKTKLATLSMDKKKTKAEEAKRRIEELRELFK